MCLVVAVECAKNTAQLSSHRSRRQIVVQNNDLAYTPAFVIPVRGGSRRSIAKPFGIGKLEWWGYRMVKEV